MIDEQIAKQQLTEFVSGVFDEKNLTHIDPDVRSEVIDDMAQLLRELIDRAVIAAMPESKLDAFNSLLENPDTSDEQVRDFVLHSGVDIQATTRETMIRFRELYLENVLGAEA